MSESAVQSTNVHPPAPELVSRLVPLSQVEHELARQMSVLGDRAAGAYQRARMSNLVIYCNQIEQLESVLEDVPEVLALHPARVLLLVSNPRGEPEPVSALVSVRLRHAPGGQEVWSEQVILRAGGNQQDHLHFAVRGLLIGDLPTNLWWASTQPPALAGPFLAELAENAEQIIYDSYGWPEPARGVLATAPWIEKFERSGAGGRWRVASDLNWRRLRVWRRLLSQALDPATAPGALDSISEVYIEHGPHGVIAAWELVSWLASRLGWQVQVGRVQPNVEIAWQALAPHGVLRIRIHRLAEGPAQIVKIKIACANAGKLVDMVFSIVDERHLMVVQEGLDVSPRTVSIRHQDRAELIGRQLTDRDRDRIFRESMALALKFAQTVGR